MSSPSPLPSTLEEGYHLFRTRLLSLAERHLHPMLQQRLSAEDILQETLKAAAERSDYLAQNPEVPLYFKLRHLLFQTLVDAERKHLKAEKRDLYREVPLDFEAYTGVTPDEDAPRGVLPLADISSPFTKIARNDRHTLLRRVLATLPETDRTILALRHFDDCTNAECAAILKITEKAASLRYVRALTRLQEQLEGFTEFQAP